MSGDPPGDPDGLDAIADALYAQPLSAFTPARDAQAADTRRAGRRELATAVKALRKPTASAWLVNQVVRGRRGLVDELISLGAGLREATSAVSGPALREIAAQRTRLVGELVRAAEEVAGAAGSVPSIATLDEVRATFEAAVADDAVARRVAEARLTRAETYAGFGFAGPLGPAPARPTEAAPQPAAPATAAPVKAAPSRTAPGRAAPSRTAPGRAAPSRTAPGRAAPSRAASGRAAPDRAAERAQAQAERRRRAEAAVTAAGAAARRAAAEAERAERTRERLAGELERLRERVADLERRHAEASLEARSSAKRARDAEAELLAARKALSRLPSVP